MSLAPILRCHLAPLIEMTKNVSGQGQIWVGVVGLLGQVQVVH